MTGTVYTSAMTADGRRTAVTARARRLRAAALTAVAGLAAATAARPAAAADVVLNNGDTQTYTPTADTATAGFLARFFNGASATNVTAARDYSGAPTVTAAAVGTGTGATPLNITYSSTNLPGAGVGTVNGTSVENFAAQYLAKMSIPSAGTYTFSLNSDDGTRLFIDGRLVIANDGGQGGTVAATNAVTLSAGLHEVRVDYTQGTGGAVVRLTAPTTPAGVTFSAFKGANAYSADLASGDTLTVAAGATAGLTLNGTAFTSFGFGTLTAGADATLNITGADQKIVRFGSTALPAAGSFTFNSGPDVAVGQLTGALAAGGSLVKQGTGRLIFDSTAAASVLTASNTIDVQGGAATLVGTTTAANNPAGAAVLRLNGGGLVLDTKGGATAYDNRVLVDQSGTLQSVPGGVTVTLGSAARGIDVAAGRTLSVDTYAGSPVIAIAGSTLQFNGPLTGDTTTGLTKVTSTKPTSGTPMSTVAAGGFGTLILNASSPGFAGTVTLQANAGLLEGRAAAFADKPFGTGPIALQGSQLNVRGNNAATGTFALNNDVSVAGPATIDLAKIGSTADNSTVQFDDLAIGTQTLTVNTANGYQLRFNGTTTLSGDPTFNLNVNRPTVTLATLNDAGTARTITKQGPGVLVVGATNTGFASTFVIQGGSVQFAGSQAGPFDVPAFTAIGGNTAFFDPLTRVATAPAAGEIRLAANAVVAETEAGAAAAINNLGTAADVFLGAGADLVENTTTGVALGAGTPWRGLANDGAPRILLAGRFVLNGPISLLSIGGNFDVGRASGAAPTVSLVAADGVGPQVVTIAGGGAAGGAPAVRLTGGTTTPNNGVGSTDYSGVSRFVVPTGVTLGAGAGGTTNFNVQGGAGGTAIAPIEIQSGGIVDVNGGSADADAATAGNQPAGALNGPVNVLAGGTLLLNDANNLNGPGAITMASGSILRVGQAAVFGTQSAGTVPGVVVRLEADNVVNLDANVSDGAIFTFTGGNRAQNTAAGNANVITLGTADGASRGVLTLADTGTDRTYTGAITIGAGGGLIGSPGGRTMTVAGAGVSGAGNPLTIGSAAAIDGQVKNGTVTMNAPPLTVGTLTVAAGEFNFGSAALNVGTAVNVTGGTFTASGGTGASYAVGGGTGNLTVASGATFVSNTGALINANLVVNGTARFTVATTPGAGSLSGTGSVILGSTTANANSVPLTVGANNLSTAFAGVISQNITAPGVGSLTKVGTGTLTLTGASTYTGGTTINGGTLWANTPAPGSATGPGAVTVNAGGTLGGTGRVAGATTVNTGGTLAPGNSVGTLSIAGPLTFGTGGTAAPPTYAAELAGGASTAADLVQLTAAGTGGILNLANPDRLNLLPLADVGSTPVTYTIATFSGLAAAGTQVFDTVLVNGGPSQSTDPSAPNYALVSYAPGDGVTAGSGNIQVAVANLTAVPEPAAAGLLGLGAVGLLARRRRR